MTFNLNFGCYDIQNLAAVGSRAEILLLLIDCLVLLTMLVGPCFEVIKLKYSLRIEIKRNDWLLSDTSQAQNKAQ